MEEDNSLIIPKKIKLGYQERTETYTGKLGYIIQQDNKGKWRKEKSWNDWKDDKLPVDEFDNTPQDGLCLNKEVQRYNWGHFGSNRSYVRVYDPRGFEFEITPENLIGILTETDCLKRGLEGKFVYAWDGPDLVLLPCGSETYKNAEVHTARQDQKVSAKTLKAGYAYVTKKGETVVYLGKHKWTEWSKDWNEKKRVEMVAHVFAHQEKPQWEPQFFRKKDVTFLASSASSSEVMEYPTLLDGFVSTINSSPIVGFEYSPAPNQFSEYMDAELAKTDEGRLYINQNLNIMFLDGDTLVFGVISVYGEIEKFIKNRLSPHSIFGTGISYVTHNTFDTKTMEGKHVAYSRKDLTMKEARDLGDRGLCVAGVLANGKKIKIEDYNSLFN